MHRKLFLLVALMPSFLAVNVIQGADLNNSESVTLSDTSSSHLNPQFTVNETQQLATQPTVLPNGKLQESHAQTDQLLVADKQTNHKNKESGNASSAHKSAASTSGFITTPEGKDYAKRINDFEVRIARLEQKRQKLKNEFYMTPGQRVEKYAKELGLEVDQDGDFISSFPHLLDKFLQDKVYCYPNNNKVYLIDTDDNNDVRCIPLRSNHLMKLVEANITDKKYKKLYRACEHANQFVPWDYFDGQCDRIDRLEEELEQEITQKKDGSTFKTVLVAGGVAVAASIVTLVVSKYSDQIAATANHYIGRGEI